MNSVCYRMLLMILFTVSFVAAGCTTLNTASKNSEQWRIKAEQGNKTAQYQLAKSYCCGFGLRRSTRKSLYWHCRAAIQGHVPAQYELGNILSNFFNDPNRNTAIGTTDYISAYMWYTVASINGHEDALDAREKIAAQMSSDNVLRAKRWATKWKHIHCNNFR